MHLSFDLFYALTAVDAISEATTCLIEKTIINPGASSPHIRQFFYPPAAAMDLSTDATERVRMSPLRTERVRLTVMAEGLGAS